MHQELEFNFFKKQSSCGYILKTIPIILMVWLMLFAFTVFFAKQFKDINPAVLNKTITANIQPVNQKKDIPVKEEQHTPKLAQVINVQALIDLSNKESHLKALKLDKEIMLQELENSQIKLEQLKINNEIKKAQR